MLKEIYEQPRAVRDTVQGASRWTQQVFLDECKHHWRPISSVSSSIRIVLAARHGTPAWRQIHDRTLRAHRS